MLSVEIRYLDVVWSDPSTVVKLVCSRDAVEFTQTSVGWQVETTVFPSMHHYIGLYIKENRTMHNPYFITGDGSRQELLPLRVPGSDEVWWIQNSGWDEMRRRYLSELYRTAGRAELFIQGEKLTVVNNTFNFSVAELEYYLVDFKNSLWMLILDSNSVAKASVIKEVPDCFNSETLQLFHDFIQSVEHIKKKPGMVLTEVQAKLPRRYVRPVPRTFREYATQPDAKLLTSRAYRESYDTAENRYIYHCVKRVQYLLKSLTSVAYANQSSYGNLIKKEDERLGQLDQYLHLKKKKIDSRVYDNEIDKLNEDLARLDLKRLNQDLSKMFSGVNSEVPGGEYGEYTVQIGKRYGMPTSCFVQRLNGYDFKAKVGTYLVLRLPQHSKHIPSLDPVRGCELSITGRYLKERLNNGKGNSYFQLSFLEVIEIAILTHPLQIELSRLMNGRESLERKDWVVPLSNDEKKEFVMERNVSMRKISFLNDLCKKMAEFSSSIPTLNSRLIQLDGFFKERGVKKQSSCPNSMMFVQNPRYSSAKSLFKKISALKGLDEHLLKSLMVVDDIGLVNVANLYEKWCLLQIIKVLTQTYGFCIEEGWQHSLVKAVLEKSIDIQFKLTAADRQQSIVLTYEKTLESMKRPDFVIDLFTKAYSFQDGGWEISGEQRNRMILDAKFRGAMTEENLQSLINKMFEGKNYGEDGNNQVFVVHPSQRVIDHPTSPLEWGAYCDYGQSHKIDHKFGGIFVSPSLSFANSLEHLQRLIGMFLQQHSVILKNEDKAQWHNMCCISCGNHSAENLNITYSPTQVGNDRWIIECNICGLRTVKTICATCGHPLFKNGTKWTYHRTRAEQTSNVVCPSCETFL